MPFSLVDRLPLPSIRNYVIFSVTLAACSLFSSWTHIEEYMVELLNSTQTLSKEETIVLYSHLTWNEWAQCLFLALSAQLWALWVSQISHCILYIIYNL